MCLYSILLSFTVLILHPLDGPNQAMGLSFSVRPPTPAPPSLKNMYIALKNDYPTFTPPPNKGGLLTPWAERGVLMLNACLTVRRSEANSHAGRGWEQLTQKAIEAVAKKRTNGVVFMAWGTPAAKRVTGIDGERHLILKAVHPSPLSAHRGFFQCGHFRKANEWLETRYGKGGPIDWSLGGPPVGVPEEKKIEGKADEVGQKEEALKEKKVEKQDEFDDECDAEEEQAMLEAALEAEKMASSQVAPSEDGKDEKDTVEGGNEKDTVDGDDKA